MEIPGDRQEELLQAPKAPQRLDFLNTVTKFILKSSLNRFAILCSRFGSKSSLHSASMDTQSPVHLLNLEYAVVPTTIAAAAIPPYAR
jgi:hypothetical protein